MNIEIQRKLEVIMLNEKFPNVRLRSPSQKVTPKLATKTVPLKTDLI